MTTVPGMNYIELGNRIREIRIAQHKTQEDICDELDISTNHLSRIENGQTIPKMDFIFAFAKISNTSLVDFFSDGFSFNDIHRPPTYYSLSADNKQVIDNTILTLSNSLYRLEHKNSETHLTR